MLVAMFLLAGMAASGQVPQVQADREGVYPNAGGVKVAQLVHAATATVPQDFAALRRVTALIVVVGANGIPTTVQVANKVASPLDQAAIAAVRESQFEAGTLNGKPAATRIMIWVPFVEGQPAVAVSGKSKELVVPVPVSTEAANFSDEARRKHIGGKVTLEMLLQEDGKPGSVRLVLPLGAGLDVQAFKAAKLYRFKPATLAGIPVPFLMKIEENFVSH